MRFFSKKQSPQCPLDEPTRLWMENAFIWLAKELGEDKIKAKEVLLPNVEHFPIRYDSSKESLIATAEIVATQMDIDINEVNLEIYNQGIHEVGGNFGFRIFTKADENSKLSAGKYFGKNESNKYDIFIEQKNLMHPEKMVATIAHEFAHIKLLGEQRTGENNEHLTDLTTVLFGLGIFNANASFKEYQTIDTRGHYSVGYLKQREWGYALALYAYYRNERAPQWLNYLSPNIRSDFKQSEEYILANTGKIFLEEYKETSKNENDELFSGKWVGHYTYGKAYSKKLRNSFVAFTIEMKLTDGVLYGTCYEEGLQGIFDEPALIEGTVEGNNIFFAKAYPSMLVTDENDNMQAVRDKSSQAIFYSGTFTDNEFIGKWEIKSVRMDKDGAIYNHSSTGTWSMKKQ